MGLFDLFKKKPASPSAPEEPKKPALCLDEAVLMEDLPRDLSVEAMQMMHQEVIKLWDVKDENPYEYFEEMEELAEAGYGYAMNELAYAHSFGIGTDLNEEEYYRWIFRAAYAGDPASQVNVAEFYTEGLYTEFVPQDLVEGFRWYLKAAKNRVDQQIFELEDEEFWETGAARDATLQIKKIVASIRAGIYEGTAEQANAILALFEAEKGDLKLDLE